MSQGNKNEGLLTDRGSSSRIYTLKDTDEQRAMAYIRTSQLLYIFTYRFLIAELL